MGLPHYLRFALQNRSAYPFSLLWHDLDSIPSQPHIPFFHILALLASSRRVINPMGEKQFRNVQQGGWSLSVTRGGSPTSSTSALDKSSE